MDTNEQTPEQEKPVTPVTVENLLAYGYLDFAASCSQEQLEMHPDPFYYNKGEFKVYDLGGDFYVDSSQELGLKGGTRVTSMEALADMYEHFTGRIHTRYEVLEDTVPDTEGKPGIVLPLKSGTLIKAKLQGGPGNGVVVLWPKVARFYVHQIKVNGKTEGHRYQRKANTKKTFLYIGPIQ